jgi:hypothetical protein
MNIINRRVAFKVKTTVSMSSKYLVRPNRGFVAPHGYIELQIILLPQAEAPPSLADCRDRFVVVYSTVGEGDEEVGLEMFEEGSAGDLRQAKLPVILVPS